MEFLTYDKVTLDGVSMGADYKYKKDEYGLLDSENKCWVIQKCRVPDDKVVRKFYVHFKNNTKGSKRMFDYSTGLSYSDNASFKGGVFTGTEKQLSDYLDECIEGGLYIQDIYDYE